MTDYPYQNNPVGTGTLNTPEAPVSSNPKFYAERDIMEQGQVYCDHVNAMTAEGLHSKSDIAAELAHRDIQIERLTRENAELREGGARLLTARTRIEERLRAALEEIASHEIPMGVSKPMPAVAHDECRRIAKQALSGEPARSALETTAPQAPIVKVVIENGKAAYTTQYAPGLPDGTHDLYCQPEAAAPMMRDGELEQLRRIDRAARRFVDFLETAAPQGGVWTDHVPTDLLDALEPLEKALFDGRSAQEASGG